MIENTDLNLNADPMLFKESVHGIELRRQSSGRGTLPCRHNHIAAWQCLLLKKTLRLRVIVNRTNCVINGREK